tara:strand:+ start:136 stop:1923 length:1788 start_codon:yes stop_codon:yes gene_type:complete
MEELYLNGKKTDLENNSVSRTLQINNFREVQDRQANYSNNIKLPMTSNNVEVLDFLGVNGNKSNKPFETTDVKYSDDGIELINDGKAVIRKTNKKAKNYDLVIYDGAISLQELLSDLTLQDLDLSAYNHDLSVSSYLASMSNTSGYTYSDLGSVNITLERTIPLLFIHTIFDLIFTQKGWTYNWNQFNTDDFKERVFTMDKGFDLTLIPLENVLVAQLNFTGTEAEFDNSGNFENEITIGTYTAVASNYVAITFTGGFDVVYGSIFSFSVVLNGGDTILTITNSSLLDPNIINNTALNVFLESGDYLDFIILADSQQTASQMWEYRINYNFNVFLYADNSYYEIDFSTIIGEMKQIDFIKDVMQRFNLSFVKVRNRNELTFMSSEELLTGKSNAEDWSDKLSQELDEDYSNSYAQSNRFRYIYDETDNDFADGILSLTNSNLTVEKTVLTSVFKASIGSNAIGVPYQMNYWSEEGEPTQDGNRIFRIVKELNQERAIRILLTDTYVDFSNQTINTIDFSYLYYQNELTRNYPTFRNLIDKFRLKRFEFNLNLIDIYNVDFLRLKYLKQTGKYYYLNKINSFKKGAITTVELIELP